MTDWFKSIIEDFSYGGILFLMFLENVFPPIPSELIIPLAGFISTQGEMSLLGVILAGTSGSVLGGVVLYLAGRGLGEARLKRWCNAHGHWVGVSSDDLEKSEAWFRDHGAKVVLLGRLVPGVRSLISIPAGVAGLNFHVFMIYTTIGSAIWTTALAFAGQALAEKHTQVDHVIGPLSTAIVIGIIGTLIVRGFRQRRRRVR